MGGYNIDTISERYLSMKIKDKDQFWWWDCIVKETLWNRSEKVDHLACQYWCVLQGSGITKMIRDLALSS